MIGGAVQPLIGDEARGLLAAEVEGMGVTVTYRRSLSCGMAGLATLSPALLSGLAGDAEPGANLGQEWP